MAMQPTQPMEQEWHVSGADCCSPASTCCLTCILPCVTYGRTHHRLHKDPQLRDWSFCNGDCIGYWLIAHCGCQWILQMMQRSDMRKKYGLKGNGCTDCLCACFCTCCDLVQQEKEAEFRENEKTGFVDMQPKITGQMQYGA